MRALVIGLAETGLAVTRVLTEAGARVTVVEDAPGASSAYPARAAAVRTAGAELIEKPDARAVAALAASVDVVIPSPLVRPSHPALVAAAEASVAIRSEIDLAADGARMPIVAVTGTNGKTTVTTLTAAMLAASGVSAIAAGNIGRPLIEAVRDDADVVVAEVSSFQLEFTPTFHPRVAVLLAVTPDHLDWHGSFEHYVEAKARVAAHQTDADVLVYDADDDNAREIAARAPARTVGVSVRNAAAETAHVADGTLLLADGRALAPLSSMRRAFLHDQTNALASATAALEVGATLDGVRAALAEYATMPHRVALVGEAIGVRWYDDSKATNPDATLRAVASFESVVLLAGGRNKGLDLSVLRGAAARLRGVVAFGEAAPEVADAFKGTATQVVEVADMRGAVRAAAAMAQRGDVVLLSPACASFDAYPGYGARGDDFAVEVEALTNEERSRR
jgi:UDP-N-acetylmuramoylalanine--D-glutamate ligase